MDVVIPLLVIGLLFTLLILPVWAFFRIRELARRHDVLAVELREVRDQLRELLRRPPAPVDRPAVETLPPAPAPAAPLAVTSVPATADYVPFAERATPISEPPVLAPVAAEPPILPQAPGEQVPAAEPTPPSGNWEQFMGAKLFAWLGGFAGLLAVGFFLKYSFEHDLVPPAVRVTIGFLFAIGLVIGGLKTDRARYAVTAQTLIATGVVSLYTVTFACRSVYHFALFGPVPTFLLMALITVAAFFLAVRLGAEVIAILGILGGFLTPVLVSTGQDNPVGLFGYLGLLDAGLVAVALHRRWLYLVPLGAFGTIALQIAWAGSFFENDPSGQAAVAAVVCLAFAALFLGATILARRQGRAAPELTWSAVLLAVAGYGLGVYFLRFPVAGARIGLLFSLALMANLCLLTLAWFERLPVLVALSAAGTVFLLSQWAAEIFTPAMAPATMGICLGFCAFFLATYFVARRCGRAAREITWTALALPLVAFGFALFFIGLPEVAARPGLLLSFVLLADACLLVLAWCDEDMPALHLVGGAAVFVLLAAWTGRHLTAPLLPWALGYCALYAVPHTVFPLALERHRPGAGPAWLGRLFLPMALLPYLLVMMTTSRLALADPTPVFGIAGLLALLALGLAAASAGPPASDASGATGTDWLPVVALAGVAGVEYNWHAWLAFADRVAIPLAWSLAFYAVFALYPFLFRRRFDSRTGPWAAAALAGVAQFSLVRRLVPLAWPGPWRDLPGLLPALFAIAPLLSLAAVRRAAAADERTRLNQLAWFGGVALFFLTLVIPIQFERQWITLGWALEGAALCWLFHRVPHPGLRAVGVGLLATAFARLALNPAVLAYHARSDTAIFNWYLYTYGVVTACLFGGAALLAPPRERVLGVNAPALLSTLGTVLAFILLNIEIADYFSAPGQRVLTFQFSGNFARDMSYTIGWALFALGLLLASIWKLTRAGRYAALTLLSVTLLKLFLHDLARLDALYRVGALLGVAVIAILASVTYQRFLPTADKNP